MSFYSDTENTIPQWYKEEGNYSLLPKIISCDDKYNAFKNDIKNWVEEEPKITGRKLKIKFNTGKKNTWIFYWASDSYENITKIISVEKSGKHYYTVETDFSKGVNLTKYPEKPTQPKLRPTVKGELEFGNQIGTISVRGKEHPVFEKITTFNEGGLSSSAN